MVQARNSVGGGILAGLLGEVAGREFRKIFAVVVLGFSGMVSLPGFR
jgi:hypothetical protein